MTATRAMMLGLFVMLVLGGCAATVRPLESIGDGGTSDAARADVLPDTSQFSDVPVASDAGPMTCTSDTDCHGGICSGPPGCGVVWTCGGAHSCPAATGVYCACDGVTTFTASIACIGRQYIHAGPCEMTAPAEDAGAAPDAVVESDGGVPCLLMNGWYCPPGQSCPAGDGCNSCVCQPGGTLACTEIACSPPDSGVAYPQCVNASDCPSGERCVGSEGCGLPWRCQATGGDPCISELALYCLCTGETVLGSATCPPGQYAYTGMCGLL